MPKEVKDDIKDEEGTFSLQERPEVVVDRPNIVSFEEARKLLALPKKLPDYFYKIFGRKNVDGLIQILSNPDNVDLDMLLLTEPMGVEAGNQYMACLPDYQKFRLELRELAKCFVQSLRQDKRISYYLEKSIGTRRKVVGSTLCVETYTKEDSGVVELFRLITELSTRLTPADTTFRGGRMEEFVALFQQLLFLEVLKDFDAYAKNKFPNRDSGWHHEMRQNLVITLQQHSIGKVVKEGTKITIWNSVEVLVKALDSVEKCLAHHQETLNQLVDQHKPTEELKFENDLKAEEIAWRSQMKIPAEYFRRIDGNLFFIAPVPEIGHPIGVCVGGVIFNPKTPNSDSLQFFLDRADLKIYTVTGLYSLEDHFNPKVCEALRSIFFDMILKGLRAKTEDDFEDLFVAPERPDLPETPVEEIRAGIVEEVATIQEEISSKDVESIGDEINTTVIGTIAPAKPKKANLSKFRSLSADRVLTALTGLVGEPVRIQGSHHIFEFNGKSFPIPLHFGDDVNRFILGHALRTWGLMDKFCAKIS